MSKKVSWGVLSTANIAVEKVIPAMQLGQYSQISAIASRNKEKAVHFANKLGIPKAYGNYQDLLNDKTIDAIYIPLPNHMHVEWSIKCLEAGKHVLCEKPIGLNTDQAKHLLEQTTKFPKLKIMEAFMYRFHPRWNLVRDSINNGDIGQVKNIHSVFTYYNTDPSNIRNIAEVGGGSLLDVGCYCISLARFLFNDEPLHVDATIEYDLNFKIDYLVSALLKFKKGTATFTCSTQLLDREYAEILGTTGRIEIPYPFIPSEQLNSKITIINANSTKEKITNKYNQYTLQGDAFSKAILNNTAVPTSLKDAINNIKIIDKLFKNAKTNL